MKTGSGRHKHKHKHMKNGQVHSSRAYAYAYVVAFTSENWVDIISTSTRPWTSHRPLWPRPHVNISKAIWQMLCTPSCLSYQVEESWYRELSQVCHSVCRVCMSLCLCLCASENQALEVFCPARKSSCPG